MELSEKYVYCQGFKLTIPTINVLVIVVLHFLQWIYMKYGTLAFQTFLRKQLFAEIKSQITYRAIVILNFTETYIHIYLNGFYFKQGTCQEKGGGYDS